MNLPGTQQTLSQYVLALSHKLRQINTQKTFHQMMSVYEVSLKESSATLELLLRLGSEERNEVYNKLNDLYYDYSCRGESIDEIFTAIKSLQILIEKIRESTGVHDIENTVQVDRDDGALMQRKKEIQRALLAPLVETKCQQLFCTPLFYKHKKAEIQQNIHRLFNQNVSEGILDVINFNREVVSYLDSFRPLNNLLVTLSQFVESTVEKLQCSHIFSYELQRYLAQKAQNLLLADLSVLKPRKSLHKCQKKIKKLAKNMVYFSSSMDAFEERLQNFSREIKNSRSDFDCSVYLNYKKELYQSTFDSCAAMAERKSKMLSPAQTFKRLSGNWAKADAVSQTVYSNLPPRLSRSIEVALVATFALVTGMLALPLIAAYNKKHYNSFSLLKPMSFTATKVRRMSSHAMGLFRSTEVKTRNAFQSRAITVRA